MKEARKKKIEDMRNRKIEDNDLGAREARPPNEKIPPPTKIKKI